MLPNNQKATGGELYARVTSGTPKTATDGPPVPRVISKEMFLGSPNGAMFGWADLLLHLGCWVTVLVFDSLVFDQANKWNTPIVNATSGVTTPALDTVSFPYALAGLILSCVAFGFLFIILVYHLFSGNKITTELAPFVLAIIMGSTKASLLMSMVYTLFTTSPATSSDQWKTWTIFLLVGKTFLVSILTHNVRKYV